MSKPISDEEMGHLEMRVTASGGETNDVLKRDLLLAMLKELRGLREEIEILDELMRCR